MARNIGLFNEIIAPVATDVMHVRRNSDSNDPDKRMALDKLVWAVGAQTIAGAKTFSNLLTAQAGIVVGPGQGTLKDYLTNTPYTPVLTGSVSNPSVTYIFNVGSWSREGDKVFYEFQIAWSAVSGGSGDVRISIPHVPVKSARAVIETTGVNFGAVPATVCFAPAGAALGTIRASMNNAAVVTMQCNMLAANQYLIGGGFYWVTP